MWGQCGSLFPAQHSVRLLRSEMCRGSSRLPDWRPFCGSETSGKLWLLCFQTFLFSFSCPRVKLNSLAAPVTITLALRFKSCIALCTQRWCYGVGAVWVCVRKGGGGGRHFIWTAGSLHYPVKEWLHFSLNSSVYLTCSWERSGSTDNRQPNRLLIKGPTTFSFQNIGTRTMFLLFSLRGVPMARVDHVTVTSPLLFSLHWRCFSFCLRSKEERNKFEMCLFFLPAPGKSRRDAGGNC